MKRLWIAIVAALLAGSAMAQPPPQGPLDSAGRTAIVTKAADSLRDRYIYPDVGLRAGDALKAHLAAGDYDAISDRVAFATKLTEDLALIAHDKHLRVMTMGGPPPAGLAPPPRSEFGVVRADRLAGDIGYIEISGFPPPGLFRAPLDGAMKTLQGSKALIVDLRRNGGGSPQSVSYLVSYFAPAGAKLHINDLIWRNPSTETFRTQEFFTVETPFRYLGRPVILLTSKRTFSGGEEFANDMQTQKLATLIGETTGGGANPGGGVDLAPGVVMFLPGGRAVNPITKTSWEGVGVKPDLASPSAEALKAAMIKLGQKPSSAEVDSTAPLFRPHAAPAPGTEAALKRVVPGFASGAPDYDLLTPEFAESARKTSAERLKAPFDKLGALTSVSFFAVDRSGADLYDATFANGSLRLAITLGPDGKVAMFGPDN
jgi:hypothetical protein